MSSFFRVAKNDSAMALSQQTSELVDFTPAGGHGSRCLSGRVSCAVLELNGAEHAER